MTTLRPLACLSLWCCLQSAALPARAAAAGQPPPSPSPAPAETPVEPAETPIPVPALLPTGFLLAWKPMVLSDRVDGGNGQAFGSDSLQVLRGLARYTFAFNDAWPFVGRVEAEGGEFKTDQENATFGSHGWDLTLHAQVGAATRITSGFTVLATVGAITRYQHGYANGGAPTLGVFGAVSNMELEFRLLPVVTLSLFAEGAIAPFSYSAQPTLGNLSDTSEFRGRIQVSYDLTPTLSIDVGYDYTRWHASFTQSTITGNTNPDKAFLVEQHEYATTLGLRWHR